MNCRYRKLQLYLGITATKCTDMKAQTFCKVMSEFSLEYKITREKILAQRELSLRKAKQKQCAQKQQQKKKSAVDVSVDTRVVFSCKQ